jgi:hypothetical protein
MAQNIQIILKLELRLQNFTKRKAMYSKVLEKLKLEHPAARVALGYLYYGKPNTPEALTEWQTAFGKNPYNEDSLMYQNLSKTNTEIDLVTQ